MEFEGWNFSRQPCSQSLLDSVRSSGEHARAGGELGGGCSKECVRGRKAVLCVFLQIQIGLEYAAKEFFPSSFLV